MVDLEKLKKQKSIKELIEFGIINIDKPSGPTSFDVSNFIKRELNLRKTSHFGTLDPKVTGVLPVALNRACKFTGFFLGEDKEYAGVMRIHKEVEMTKIQKAIKEKFTGKIIQLPPVKSRVKRAEREREIKKFELLEIDKKDILFKAEVQGGTYIRKLISDLGDYMKIGAHMLELRRVRAGIFEERNSVNLYDFEKAVKEYKEGNEEYLRRIIIPAEIISKVYPVVQIKGDNLKQIFTGKPIYKKDLIKIPNIEKKKIICIFNKDKFIEMAEVINERDIFAKSKFVFQEIP